uniref:Microtubule associated protein 4 like n=1 Tax=Myripristis murdjan TaxID=586833 RepID=A0A667XRE2_9TELE
MAAVVAGLSIPAEQKLSNTFSVHAVSVATRPRPRPASTTTPTPPAATTNGDAPTTHRRRTITKPPVPKQTPMEKKPAVPRAPRTPRPINAPTPDLKNVRSKIGSIDNIKYQPGGGKVQILNKKVDLSKVTSKCGSKDNIKHKPGQTENSCALFSFMLLSSSLVNSIQFYSHINLFLFAPGGGDVKIESHKINIKGAPLHGQTHTHTHTHTCTHTHMHAHMYLKTN